MNKIDHFESSDFTLEGVVSKKRGRRVYVIFSTCGERESELIYDKIRLLKTEAGGLIDRVILSHRRRGISVDATENKAKEADPRVEVFISSNICVPDMDDEKGKGSDMRRAVYQINAESPGSLPGKDVILVFLDSDVVPEYFGAHFVIGLVGPVLDGYDVAKASFWRALGRVKKYVAQPLYSLIDHPGIKKMTGFAYPLSGELAGTLEFFNSVNFWQIYGIETGINIDSCLKGWKIADVNLGLYDHKHQSELDIQQMSFGIIRTFFIQLIDNGILRLEDGAKISDVFKASFIDEKGKRKFMEYDLSERKYQPIRDILANKS